MDKTDWNTKSSERKLKSQRNVRVDIIGGAERDETGTYLVGGGEAALVGGDAIDELVALGLPRRRFARGGVELVVEQREGLLAAERRAGEERTVAHGELDLDVDAVGLTALDERRPQPVVDVVVGHVAHHVRPPVDALLEVGEAFFHPLQINESIQT